MELNQTKNTKDTYSGAAKTVDKYADKFVDKFQSGVEQVSDKAHAIESKLASRYDSIRDSAAEGYGVAVDTVRKYPLYAVLGSTAIGMLAGLLIARRKY